MKRAVAYLLVFIVMITMAACGRANPTDPTIAKPGPTITLPKETQPTETQPPEQDVTALDVLIGGHYISEWTEEYIPLGMVEWESLLLDDACAAEYPALAGAGAVE